MPELYVRGKGEGKAGEGLQGAGREEERKGNSNKQFLDNEEQIAELASFCRIPEGTRFETQQDKERLILLVRAHPIINLPWIVVAVVMAAAPVAFKYFGVLGLLPVKFALVGGLFWYLVLVAFVLEQFLNWYFNVYIVTDERIVDIDFLNLLYKRVSDAKLDKVQDVTYAMGGVVRSLFNFGSVFIQTAAEVPLFEFTDVSRPDRVAAVIRALVVQEEQEVLEGRVR